MGVVAVPDLVAKQVRIIIRVMLHGSSSLELQPGSISLSSVTVASLHVT